MLECQILEDQCIATVILKKPRFGFGQNLTLEDGFNRLDRMDLKGIIFDASGLSKMSNGMLGGLLDVILRLERARAFKPFGMAFALCGLPEKALSQAKAHGFERIIPLFPDTQAARSDSSFKSVQLRGVNSIVLCANQGARLAPLTSDTPAALLDFLGRPILGHVLDHAARFGLRDFILNPGFCEQKIQDFARSQPTSIFCVNESAWQKHQSDDVSTLVRLHTAHDGFAQDSFIFQSSVLSDVDLADMMRSHQDSGADATIAVAQNRAASACDQGLMHAEQQASAMILSPYAAEMVSKQNQITRETMIIPVLRAAQLNVQLFVSDHTAAAIKCGADYFSCQSEVLRNGAYGVKLNAEQVTPQTWMANGADLDPKARVDGPCFIGPNAQVLRDSILKGSNVIGEGSQVLPNAILSNSILMSNTRVNKSSVVDHMIASAHWSVNHMFADGSLQNRAALDGVSSASDQVSTRLEMLPRVAKMA